MLPFSSSKLVRVIMFAALLQCCSAIIIRAEEPNTSKDAIVPLASANAQSDRGVKAFKDCPDCPDMVVVAPGEFQMGSTQAEIDNALADVPPGNGPLGLLSLFGMSDSQTAKRFMAYQKPKHLVRISKPFALGRFPITRAEFAAFVKETGYKTGLCWIFGLSRPIRRSNTWADPNYEQTDRDPVVCVTWEDAQAYINWLNKKLGQDPTVKSGGLYRLPSEAEWEYSARAGSQTKYPWGNQIGHDNALCNGCNERLPLPDGTAVQSQFSSQPQRTLPVGSFPPNPFGLFDMIGNVGELTEDCWHESYVGAPTDGSAWIDDGCQRRTQRGDSWRGPPWAAQSASRSGDAQSDIIYDRGFRVAKTLP